jgi:MFS family permease
MDKTTDWPKNSYGWFLTILLTITYTVSFIDRQVLNLLVEPIKHDLNLNDIQISLIQGPAFATSYILMSVPFGRLADKINRIKVLVGGIFFWSVATAGCGAATNATQLIVARSGVGAGEAALTPASWSILADVFPEEKRNFPISFFLMGPYLGAGLALIFGGQLLKIFKEAFTFFDGAVILEPWQLSFIVVSMPGFLLVFILALLKDPKRREKLHHDVQTKNTLKDAAKFLKSGFGAYFPLLIGTSFLVVLLYGLQAWIPTYLYRIHGWALSDAGLTYGPIALIAGSTGVLSGPILDRYLVKRNKKGAPLIVAVIASIVLSVAGPITFFMSNAIFALIGIFILSFFVTLPLALMATSLQRITPNDYRGFISGLYVVTVNIMGLGAGPTIVAFLTDAVYRNESALNLSLATFFAFFAPVALLIFAFGRKPYLRALEHMNKAA